MDRKALISEIKGTYPRRRSENWLIVVTVMVITMALAAGLDYALETDLNLLNEIVIWGGALLWVMLFTVGHMKVMDKLAESEKKVVEKLEAGEKYKYDEEPESAFAKLAISLIATIIGLTLLYIILDALVNERIIGEHSFILTAELTVILFAGILALISSFIRLFPLNQRYYKVKVSTFGDDSAIIQYRVRRMSDD